MAAQSALERVDRVQRPAWPHRLVAATALGKTRSITHDEATTTVVLRSDLRSLLQSHVPRRHVIAFYVGIPLGLAYLFGINYMGMARHFGLGLSLLYWIGVMLPFWWVLDLASRISALVLRPWKLPWWTILFAGSVLAIVVVAPYIKWHAAMYSAFLPEGVSYEPPPSIWYVLGNWKRLISFSGVPLVWISVNYFYDRIIDIPRYRGSVLDVEEDGASAQRAAEAGHEPLADSDLLRRVPERLGRNILALQAEDHYVRVFTDRGSGLVRYKFRDAVQELASLDGLQVHRSYWVARTAVKNIEADGQGYKLILPNGVVVPVSRAYREAIKVAGVLPD